MKTKNIRKSQQIDCKFHKKLWHQHEAMDLIAAVPYWIENEFQSMVETIKGIKLELV